MTSSIGNCLQAACHKYSWHCSGMPTPGDIFHRNGLKDASINNLSMNSRSTRTISPADQMNWSDFSVVRFRSTLMLFSEKNRMKVHKNQWLLTMLYPLVRLAGATSRGQTMAPEGQKPSKWLCLTKLPREMYPQPIVHKALSWGAMALHQKSGHKSNSTVSETY